MSFLVECVPCLLYWAAACLVLMPSRNVLRMDAAESRLPPSDSPEVVRDDSLKPLLSEANFSCDGPTVVRTEFQGPRALSCTIVAEGRRPFNVAWKLTASLKFSFLSKIATSMIRCFTFKHICGHHRAALCLAAAPSSWGLIIQ